MGPVAIIDRIKHWPSSLAGVSLSAGLYATLNSMDCQVPMDWKAWALVAGPTILGTLFPKTP